MTGGSGGSTSSKIQSEDLASCAAASPHSREWEKITGRFFSVSMLPYLLLHALERFLGLPGSYSTYLLDLTVRKAASDHEPGSVSAGRTSEVVGKSLDVGQPKGNTTTSQLRHSTTPVKTSSVGLFPPSVQSTPGVSP